MKKRGDANIGVVIPVRPMSLPLQPEPVAVIEVLPAGAAWRLTSSDGLFSGLFRDRTTAVRYAEREATWHPGHVVVIRDESR